MALCDSVVETGCLWSSQYCSMMAYCQRSVAGEDAEKWKDWYSIKSDDQPIGEIIIEQTVYF